MTIILFLVDTSASMNQRTYLGARPTLLDVAKDAVEKFLKLRQRDPASRGDRYMLLTFEDPPGNIKAGWKEHHNVFMTELKNLTASGMTTLGASLKHAFDLLNLNRMQTGIDTYGHGRCPFYFEPSIIIVITDGGRLSSSSGVQEELILPMHSSVPGSDLTKEPFRWDQRLFALVLRLTGTLPSEHLNGQSGSVVACDSSPIDAMCDVTGGRSYAVSSQRSLIQCLESIVSKIQGGVVIQFEKVGADPLPLAASEDEKQQQQMTIENSVIGPNGSLSNGFVGAAGNCVANLINGLSRDALGKTGLNGVVSGWTSTRKLIYVQRSAQKGYSVGHWPIPEAFWPNLDSPSLPPRSAHPVIKFTCTTSDPMIVDNLPFDKYELEPSPLTQTILSRKQPQVAWQCFVSNSHKNSELGLPFGYLKASTTLSCVNLFVLPYNYPVLLPLLEELFKIHHCKPTREWKSQFEAYLKNLPLYYASPLKRALQRMGATPSIVPDTMETCLNFTVINHLKRFKNNAKAEFEKVVMAVSASKPVVADTIRVINAANTKKISDIDFNLSSSNSRFVGLRTDLNEFPGFQIHIKDKNAETKFQCYRNAFDISRHELIDQIHRMRSNFLQPPGLIKFHDEDQIHSLPVSQMGNYQEYLKKMPVPLRELESAPVRQHMFGNPFKLDKRGMLVDETDIDLVGNGGSSPVRSPRRPTNEAGPPMNPSRTPRRRPGPLPREFTMRSISRSSTGSSIGSSSPAHSTAMPSPPPSPTPLPVNIVLGASASSSSAPEVIAIDRINAPVAMGYNNSTPEQPPRGTFSPISKAVPTLSPSSDTENGSLPIVVSSSTARDQSNETKQPSSQLLANNNSIAPSEATAPMEVDLVPPSTGRLGEQDMNNGDMYTLNYVAQKPESNYGSDHNHSSDSRLSPPEMNGRLYSKSESSKFDQSTQGSNTTSSLTNGPSLQSDSADHQHNPAYSNSGKRVKLSLQEIDMKRALFRLVRKPGKNYNELAEALSKLSPPSFREYAIHETQAEAKRFKRDSMVNYLQHKLDGNFGPAASSAPSTPNSNFNNHALSNNNNNLAGRVNSLSMPTKNGKLA